MKKTLITVAATLVLAACGTAEDDSQYVELNTGAEGSSYLVGGPVCTTARVSAWGACYPNGTQTRTLLAVIPVGCDVTKLTIPMTQACKYVAPPRGQCLEAVFGPYGTCQPNGFKTRPVIKKIPVPGQNANCTVPLAWTQMACTYSAVPCNGVAYGQWSDCYPNNLQYAFPQLTSPRLCDTSKLLKTQACVYTPPVF